jgi:iron complex outermembrane receptor protein
MRKQTDRPDPASRLGLLFQKNFPLHLFGSFCTYAQTDATRHQIAALKRSLMRIFTKRLLAFAMAMSQATLALANVNGNDAFQFFAEEAKVVSASHQPQDAKRLTSTVYVVTSEEIKDSGATTIWDALRNVPGLDVMTSRTPDGAVSVRGINQNFNARTLIMLDGRRTAHSFNDWTSLETLPVSIDEIDRIEVVEGPGSAVYGPNAINGVINIITKTPQQLSGGIASYTGGQRQTHIVNAIYGREYDNMKYKTSGSWNQTNSLEDDSRKGLRSGRGNMLVGWKISPDSELDLAGGLNQLNGDFAAGTAGTGNTVGTYFYSRMDYRLKDTQLMTYWNGERSTIDVSGIGPHQKFDADRFYTKLGQTLHLPWKNEMVLGGDYQHLHSDVSVYDSGQRARDLWAAYAEDRWDMHDKWTLMANGRVDSYPLTPITFSALGSLLYAPETNHTIRASAGQSFRNPDRGENNLDTTVQQPNTIVNVPPFGPIPFATEAQLLGYRDLMAERMTEEELAYRGRVGSIKTGLTGFHYVLDDIMASGQESPIVTFPPPNILVPVVFANRGQVEAWGGEFTMDYLLTSYLTTFANYSFQDVTGDTNVARDLADQSPRHKVNLGFRVKQSGWTTSMSGHWVDSTHWRNYSSVGGGAVNAYWMLDGHIGYAFKERLQGLEIGVSALNILNHKHYEFSQPANSTPAGQRGEMLGNRWTGNITYKF